VPVTMRGDAGFAERDSFLISPAGKVVKVWIKVNPNTHSDDVLGAIAGLNGNDKVETHKM
jgi:peroxiredoxin Q/BCP